MTKKTKDIKTLADLTPDPQSLSTHTHTHTHTYFLKQSRM